MLNVPERAITALHGALREAVAEYAPGTNHHAVMDDAEAHGFIAPVAVNGGKVDGITADVRIGGRWMRITVVDIAPEHRTPHQRQFDADTEADSVWELQHGRQQ